MTPSPHTGEGKFGIQISSDWPQMGQIRDIFRSDFSTFGSTEPNGPFGANLTDFGAKPDIPAPKQLIVKVNMLMSKQQMVKLNM